MSDNDNDKDATSAALIAAVTAGDAAGVTALLDQGADANARDARNLTMLFIATETGQLDIMRRLLERGADPDAGCGKDNWANPLGQAAYGSNADAVKLLLEYRAEVNCLSCDMTPLAWASEKGSMDIVRMLLDKDASVDMRDKRGGTALMRAAVFGHEDIARELIAQGADVNAADKSKGSPLKWATFHKYDEIVKLLTENGAVIKKNPQEEALFTAIKAGEVETVSRLLDQGVNANASDDQNNTGLLLAAEANQPEIITLLLAHHADINATAGLGSSITALGNAAYCGSVEAARVLIEAGADVNQRSGDDTPLGWASSKRGRIEIVRMLLERGADPEKRGEYGGTPVINASVYGKEDIAELLVAKGAHVNADKHSGSALRWACWHDHAGIAQILVDHGADIDAKDKEQKTPMEVAETRGSRRAISVLRDVFDARARKQAEEAEQALCLMAESSKILARDLPVRGPLRLKHGIKA